MVAILWTLAGLGLGIALDRLVAAWGAASYPATDVTSASTICRRLLLLAGLPVVFLLLALVEPDPTLRWVAALFATLLLLLAVIDLDFRVVPNFIAFPAALLGVLLSYQQSPAASIAAGLSAAAVFYLLFWLGERFFGPGALGMGDVKAAMAIGAMLGPAYAPAALLLGMVFAGALAVFLLATHRAGKADRLPYAYCLATAAVLVLLYASVV